MADDIVLGIKIKLDGKDVDGQVRVLTGDFNKLNEAVKDQANSAGTSARQTAAQTDAMRDLGGTARAAADAVLSVGKSAVNAAGTVTGLKHDIEGLRHSLMLFAAEAAVAGAQAARAIGFEAQFADVKKVVEGARAELKKLESDLKSLSTAISVPLDGLAQIAAQGGQLGLPIGELTQFTELVAKMSVGFNLLPEEAGNALGVLRNIFQLTLPELERFGDQINTVADNSNTSERELLNLISRVGDTAQQFGLLRSETLGLSAAILSLGKPPEVAATALENMLTSLRNADLQTQDFQSALAAMGLNARKLAQDIDKNPKAALDRFLQTLSELNARSRSGAITQLFGKGQDAVVINQLISSLNEYRRIVKLASQEELFSGSLARTFEEREKTVEAAFQRMRNAISVFSINVADMFLPAIRFAADGLRDLATGMAAMAEQSPNLTAFAGITAALLPLAGVMRLVSAAATLIAPAIGPAVTALGSLMATAAGSGVLATLRAGLVGVSGVLTALSGSVLGRLVLGVGAAATAFSGLGAAILSLAASPLTVLAGGLAMVAVRVAGAGSVLGGLAAAAATVGRGLLALVGGPIGATIAGLSFLGVKFLQVKDDAIEFGGVQTTVSGVIAAAWGAAKDAVAASASDMIGYFAEMGQDLLSLSGVNDQTWTDIKNTLATAGDNMAAFAKDAVNNVIRRFAIMNTLAGEELDKLMARAKPTFDEFVGEAKKMVSPIVGAYKEWTDKSSILINDFIDSQKPKFHELVNWAKAAAKDISGYLPSISDVGNIYRAYQFAQEKMLNGNAGISREKNPAIDKINQTDYVGLFVSDIGKSADELNKKFAAVGKSLEDTIAARIRAGVEKGVKSLPKEKPKQGSGKSLEGELDGSGNASKAAERAAARAAKAEANRREEIAKTIQQIQLETSLIGLSDKERSRAVELTQALTKAKGSEVEAITQALEVKWKELDADQRRSDMWAELVNQANALDKLHDDAAESNRLAALAKELQVQGLSNKAIRERIELEQALASAREANPDLDQKQVEDYVKQRANAEKTLSDIVDDGSQKSADFFDAAWKRAAENIQDAMANMFENLLNGDATNSFEDFFKNISRSFNRILAEQISTSIQGMIQKAFTSGNSGGSGSSSGVSNLFGSLMDMFKGGGSSGSSSGGFFSGIMDMFGGLFGGGSSASGSSYFKGNGPLLSYQNGFWDNKYFKGNGPLLSYMNGANTGGFGGMMSGFGNLASNFFSMGKGGGFSLSGSNGGGAGWAIAGSLLKMIPGFGDWSMKGPGRNAQLETLMRLQAMGTGIASYFFPPLALDSALSNAGMNLGSKLFSGIKPSSFGYLLGNMGFFGPGPIGQAIGAFLLGEKIPQPTEWTKGRYSNGKMTIGKSGIEDGGNEKTTIDFTKSFGIMITNLGHQLSMSFRDFSAQFWHQLDDTGTDQFAGGLGDKGGNFWVRQLSSGGDFKTLANQAALAVIKRNIASQDDLYYRAAIRDSKGMKGLQNRIAQIDQIGLSIGEYGEALTQLKAINAQFDEIAVKAAKFRFTEDQVESARQRAIDSLKTDTISAFRQLAGLGPTLAAQLGGLNNQLIALEANARSLKLAESELVGLRAKAIAQAREQYLAPLTDASASIADQIASITGVLPTAEATAPLFDLLKASTDPTEQRRYIDRIQSALTTRYNSEIAQINKVGQAVNNLKAFVDGLKLSDLSPLSPEDRLREAQGQYGTTLLKAQAGDPAALANLANTAQSYLQEARSFYASSPAYADIFSNVTDTLSGLGETLGGTIDADTAAADAANTLADSLQSLSDVIQQIIASQGAAFDQQAAALPAAPSMPAKNFQDLTEDQMAANIAALPANASKAEKAAVKAENKDLQSQIKAWLAGGDEELAKTQAYQALTQSIADAQEQLKGLKKSDPQYGPLKAELSGLVAQRKALGKVKFREQGGWTQGLTIVGENGPELINFARPTQVQSNRQTQSIIAGGNDRLVAELQKANEELAALVRLQMQANQALLDRLDKIASASSAMERKTRLGSAA
jgi:TP901 family phage tail tape measure protein